MGVALGYWFDLGMSLQNRAQIDLILIRLRALEIQIKRLQKHRPLSDNYIILEANP